MAIDTDLTVEDTIANWRKGSRKPLIISVTEATDSFGRCETSWLWGSMNGFGLERPLPSAALSLGSLFHYTMADWGALYAGIAEVGKTNRGPGIWKVEKASAKPDTDPLSIFEAHYAAFKESVLRKYETLNGSEMDDDEYEEGYEVPVGEMGRAMVTNYYRRYGSPYPEDCTLIAPEQTLVIPVPKVRPHQRQIYLEGTLDQMLADAEGNILIRDFKTYNDKPSDYELDANSQFMSYHWMVREEFPDYKVAGVIYDGVWKRTAITSRMRNKTDDDLQYRYYCLYSDEKIDNHAKILPFLLAGMAQKLRDRKRYGPNALNKSRGWATCPGCSFNDPCQQLLDGDFGEWDDEAEALALADYRKREKSPAWRIPLPSLVEKVA